MTKVKKILISFLIPLLSFNLLAQSNPFESTYEPLPSINVLIKNANIYDGEGNEF